MQGNNQQGNQGSNQKQGGLSWTQPPQSAKPISQVTPPPMSAKSPLMPTASKKGTEKTMPTAPKGMPSMRTFGIFAAGIIAGLIIGWGWFSYRADDVKVATTPSETTDTTTPTAGTGVLPSTSTTGTGTASDTVAAAGALSLASPQDAGTRAIVSNISVTVPTWVAIYDNVGGRPGNVLGAAMFFPGDTTGVVELLRGTTANQTYFAGEYVDNGDHIFSKQQDMEVKGITGNPLLVEFRTR